MIKKRWWICCLLGILLLSLLLGSLGFCRMAQHVWIGGLDVSGMRLWEAYQAVTEAENALRGNCLTIQLPNETIALTHKTLNLQLNRFGAVFSAYQEGRKHQEITIPLTHLLQYDEESIRSQLEAYAEKYDTSLTQPVCRLEGVEPERSTLGFDANAPCQTLVLNPGTPECHLDIDVVLADIRDLYAQAFALQEYTLSHTSVPTVLPDPLDLDAVYAEYSKEPQDDTLDMETYQQIPGSYGYRFDLDTAKEKLNLAEWGQDVSVSMELIPPEILGDAVYFRDVLGHCETKHTNNENRNTNLRLVCEFLDGLILQPGEEFSYNASVGERTEERGFKPAGAYSGTRLVQSIGGGVCQGSTTLYNCALLADLEVLERHDHGFTVNYVPIGLDAAVNWATKTDLRFRNNWNFPIMIKAEVSDGYMRMQILGTDEKDYYIEMVSTRGEGEYRIYSNSYKKKFDKKTGELISKELEARSSYMYYSD